MPDLVTHMFLGSFGYQRMFDKLSIADFVLTVLGSYRKNPYHNAEHAFCFTHTMYLILINNSGSFDFVEVSQNSSSSFRYVYASLAGEGYMKEWKAIGGDLCPALGQNKLNKKWQH